MGSNGKRGKPLRARGAKRKTRTADEGTGYGRNAGTYRRELTEVGAGTPMGELLRRYWHPVALAADAGTTPRRIRHLGEDLVLFRAGNGSPGLVVERCTHRGASLLYGRVEDEGIRCCYHGWLYGPEGHCLDKAVEPEGGKRRAMDRQPWYPVEERYGLIFAYLGSPERKPVLPRYDNLEGLRPGEIHEADSSGYPAGGPEILDFNWFQHYENYQDAGHVLWLHFLHSGNQFGETHRLAGAKLNSYDFLKGRTWHATASGMKYQAVDTIAGGRQMRLVVQNILPNVGVVPEPANSDVGVSDQLHWLVPMDDTNFRIFVVRRVDTADQKPSFRFRINGKEWTDRTEEERRAHPGDYEAQRSQGLITLHSTEHLSLSDRGVIMLRRIFEDQLKAIAAGRDPLNVAFTDEAAVIKVEGGRFAVTP